MVAFRNGLGVVIVQAFLKAFSQLPAEAGLLYVGSSLERPHLVACRNGSAGLGSVKEGASKGEFVVAGGSSRELQLVA